MAYVASLQVTNFEAETGKNIAVFIILIDKYVPASGEYKQLDFAQKAMFLVLNFILSVAYGTAFDYIGSNNDAYNYA